MGAKKAETDAIGHELLAVLPNDNIPWYKKPHLLRLNFSLLSLVLFCWFLQSMILSSLCSPDLR